MTNLYQVTGSQGAWWDVAIGASLKELGYGG